MEDKMSMIKIFTEFVREFHASNKKTRSYLYTRFSQQLPFYVSLIGEDNTFILLDSINEFVILYNDAWIWSKSRVVSKSIIQFVERM